MSTFFKIRARRALGTVCEACGKHFDTADGFDKHPKQDKHIP